MSPDFTAAEEKTRKPNGRNVRGELSSIERKKRCFFSSLGEQVGRSVPNNEQSLDRADWNVKRLKVIPCASQSSASQGQPEHSGAEEILQMGACDPWLGELRRVQQPADGKMVDGSLLGDANGVDPVPGRVKNSGKWQKPRFSRKALMKCCLVKWIIASTQPQDKVLFFLVQISCCFPLSQFLPWCDVQRQAFLSHHNVTCHQNAGQVKQSRIHGRLCLCKRDGSNDGGSVSGGQEAPFSAQLPLPLHDQCSQEVAEREEEEINIKGGGSTPCSTSRSSGPPRLDAAK
ncbi:hypothetical protein CCH79_00007040 [Gambusia affinis]|uniref:Uncharacterized protein n=1 Tax=Gambusia affinis TaxID=33528 RepID=A0A315V8F8_GAMAF|nr:hypothetical protein CCH79_00007040 [Gambusia affinis]